MTTIKTLDHGHVFVHRANFIEDEAEPLRGMADLVRNGWVGMEVDITMTGPNAFEFCHPTQLG